MQMVITILKIGKEIIITTKMEYWNQMAVRVLFVAKQMQMELLLEYRQVIQ